MNSGKTEFLAGIFVLLGAVAILYLSVRVGGGRFFGGDDYAIKARFQNVSGLSVGARVNIAGVPVGTVAAITLDSEDYAAVVEMRIEGDVRLDEDTIASVKSQGLIGDKFVALLPGGAEAFLQDGDVIIDTESAVDIEGLISQFAFGALKEDEETRTLEATDADADTDADTEATED